MTGRDEDLVLADEVLTLFGLVRSDRVGCHIDLEAYNDINP